MEKISLNAKELEKELLASRKELDALRSVKQNYDLLMRHMEDFVWRVNKDFHFTYVSPSVKKLLGYTTEEFLKMRIFDMGTPDTQLQIKKAYEKRIAGKADNAQKKWKTQVFHKNGVLVWLETTTNILLNEKGEFDGLLGVSRNINDTIAIERKFQENEANLVAQIENTIDSIWSIDDAYCIKTLNSNFKTYFQSAFGIKLAPGVCIVNSLPEPFRGIWKERYDKALQGEQFKITDHFTFENVPQYVEVNFNPIVFKDKIIGISCFSRDITAHKLSEKSLVEGSANLTSLIEHTDARIWSIDSDYKIISINTNFQKDYQTAFQVMLTKGSYALENLPEPLLKTWTALYDRVLEGEPFSIIDEFKIKDIPQFVEVSFNPIRIGEKVIGAACYSRDISQQKLSELALHHSEEKFRSIFEHTTSVISIQTDTQILLVNKAYERVTGYSAEETKTLNPIDLVHPLDKERIMNFTHKRLKGEEVPTNYTIHLMNKTFHEIWLDISATVIDYEGQKATLIIGSDITERKKADLLLNKFSTGIMNSPSSIVITDIDGTVEYVNPFFSEFTGYSAEEIIGKNPNLLNSGKNPDKVFIDMWNTILKGEVWNGELLNKKKNGQFYWESARIAPIFDDNGIITNFIAIKEDITESKRTLELIEQSEKDLREINAKKDKFFSIIAHDLRSPFSGLAGLTEILRSSIKELSEEQVDTYLELISESTQNILKLLENLLSWAKSQTGKLEFNPKPLQLAEIVNETISVSSISANNKEIVIESTIKESDTVFADENMLYTVIRNLLSNAIKYTPQQGKISLFYQSKTFNKKEYTLVGIKDTGVGIPKDKQGKIFNMEDNYTTNGTNKEKGTGLGLILCKEFIEKHQGKIWCESEIDEGSTFYFSLPVRRK